MNKHLAVVALACASGCLSFQDISKNADVPSELVNRRVFATVGVYQKHLDALVGHVLFTKKTNGVCPTVYDDADLGIRPYVLPGWKPEVNNEATLRYQSKVDGSLQAHGSYFGVTAALEGDMMAQIVITDVSTLIIDDAHIPFDELETLAAAQPGPEDCQRFYIRGATLTTVTFKKYRSVKANTTVGGDAFGAGGKVYASSDQYALDFKLGVTVVPIQPGLRGPNGLRPLGAVTPGTVDVLKRVGERTTAFGARDDR